MTAPQPASLAAAYGKEIVDDYKALDTQAFEPHYPLHDDETQLEIDWTEEEEKRLVRKLDSVVMSLLILGFFALQLDRGNIGNALTDYFLRDVGITQFQYNIGQQLLSAGIVLLEIPSNIILYRIGPQKWISGQIIAWGLVATFQAFQKGLGPYLATRLLLGLCESGFIPAGLYTVTIYYKRDETSKRFAAFFFGNGCAAASTGLISYGILHMRGVCNLAGWQWLFIIEGIFTITVGVFFITLFPQSPSEPKSLLGFRYFTPRETDILRRRVIIDDPRKLQKKKWIEWEDLRKALSNWRIYPHILLTITALSPNSIITSYAPTLVNSYGYGRLKSNAMVSVGSWISLVMNLSWGFLADYIGVRGPLVIIGIVFWLGFTIGDLCLVYSSNQHARYALLTLSIGASAFWHPVNGSWMALNARSSSERSIYMAFFIMAANTSGIVGGQLFQASDAPLYHTGWSVAVGLISAGLFFASVANLQYWFLNRRITKKEIVGVPEEQAEGETGGVKRYHI